MNKTELIQKVNDIFTHLQARDTSTQGDRSYSETVDFHGSAIKVHATERINADLERVRSLQFSNNKQVVLEIDAKPSDVSIKLHVGNEEGSYIEPMECRDYHINLLFSRPNTPGYDLIHGLWNKVQSGQEVAQTVQVEM